MRAIVVALLASTLASCASVEASRQPVDVEMRNVDLHLGGEVTVHVRHLRGHFIPSSRSGIPYLDDTSSYHVMVDAGQVAIDMASLNSLLTRTLTSGESNLRKLHVSVDEKGQLKQSGTIDKNDRSALQRTRRGHGNARWPHPHAHAFGAWLWHARHTAPEALQR